MKKTLMLWPDVTEEIPAIICKNYSDIVQVEDLYRKVNKIGRAVRKVLSKLNISVGPFLNDWVKHIDSYKTIIIHANEINTTVPNVLRRMGYKGKVIYWYWNPVSNCVNPIRINRDNCEIWSFDKEDCKKYNLRYNSTYYFEEFVQKEKDRVCDIFFIGRDKGRYHILKELEENCKKYNISCVIKIIKDATSSNTGQYAEQLTYGKTLEISSGAKALVDIVQEGQNGLTLRVMESLFLQKKLITNNKSIIKERFYDANNIFVLGERPVSELVAFLESPYNTCERELIEYYKFENWLYRFDEEKGKK